MFASSIVDQVQMAAQKQNRLATVAGSIIGGFVPVATFFIVHFGVHENCWLWAIVVGGLVFSAKTVYEWGHVAFQSSVKSFGFCLLVEGVMTFGNVWYLSIAALTLLALINGLATGCNLALNRREAYRARREAIAPKKVAPKAKPKAKAKAAKKSRNR